jgi:hypothetical protein
MDLRSSNLAGRDLVSRILEARRSWIGRMRSMGVALQYVTLLLMRRSVEWKTRSWYFVCIQSIPWDIGVCIIGRRLRYALQAKKFVMFNESRCELTGVYILRSKGGDGQSPSFPWQSLTSSTRLPCSTSSNRHHHSIFFRHHPIARSTAS